jgi:hypothetical protein
MLLSDAASCWALWVARAKLERFFVGCQSLAPFAHRGQRASEVAAVLVGGGFVAQLLVQDHRFARQLGATQGIALIGRNLALGGQSGGSHAGVDGAQCFRFGEVRNAKARP